MILSLLKANAIGFFNRFRATKSFFFTIIIFLIVLGSILTGLFVYYNLLAGQLNTLGRMDIILSASFAIANVVCFVTSIYKSQGYLFGAKDFDFLFSMPIKTQSIFIYKLTSLYVSNLINTTIVCAPAVVVYMFYLKLNLFFAILMILLLPVIPITLGIIASIAILKLSLTSQNYKFMQIVLSFSFVIGIMVANHYLQSINAEVIGDALIRADQYFKFFFPLVWFLDAIVYGKLFGAAAYIGLYFLLAFVIVQVFSNNFKRINSQIREFPKNKKYEFTSLKPSSALIALYQKELRCYFSSYIYVLNTALGVVLALVYIISIVFFGDKAVAQMLDVPEISKFVLPVTTIFCTACVAVCCTTAPSISLEGKMFGLLKTFPVRFSDIVLSKVLVNLTITIPFVVVSSVLLGFGMSMKPLECFAFAVFLTAYAIFSALVGIFANLLFPRLDWVSEVQPIKRGLSVLLSLAINWISVGIPAFIYAFLKIQNFVDFSFVVSAVVFIAILILWKVINTVSQESFKNIEI